MLFSGSVFAQNFVSSKPFSREVLTIVSGKNSYKFDVELALTDGQQMQGLMFRRSMASDAGMLFVYGREEPTAMWMKNTFIPLDMLFISSEGRVAHIAERTMPMSEAIVSSVGPVLAVLELNAGTVARLGLRLGDFIVSTALGTDRKK
jgi:uncharacterized membrane protein (UPF0127 family)